MEFVLVFLIGGTGYGLLEILWRGYTHWTMLITGGICFLLLYIISTELSFIPLVMQSLLGSAAITAVEFLVGCIVNIGLGWNVWNYSANLLNVRGQICLTYSLLWFLLCLIIMPLCRTLHASVYA